MVAYTDQHEEFLTAPKPGARYLVANAILHHRRFLWVVCASIALLSARHLLVEQNIHYPLQLYFNHLAVTGLLALRPYWTWKSNQKLFCARPQLSRLVTRGTVLLAASTGVTALSTICTFQAVLHVQNQPTLVMMIMIAFFAESLLLYIIRAAPYNFAEFLRIAMLVGAGAGLLAADHRLTVPSLVSSILATLFAGVARALWKTFVRFHPDAVAKNKDQTARYVIVGTLVGIAWTWIFWKGEPIVALGFANIPFFIVNAVSSALALKLGKSMLLPMDDEVADPDTQAEAGDSPAHHVWDALTLISLTGVVGCHSTLSVRRSYTSVYQFFCFLVAIICIKSRAYIDAFEARPQSSRVSHSTHELEFSSEDSDAVSLTEKAERYGKQTSPSSLRYKRFLLGITAASLWTAFGIFNATEQPEHRSPAFLDRNYQPQFPVEIVLSMYDEPIDKVVEVIHNLRGMPSFSDAWVTIYIKDSSADNTAIKQRTGADYIVTLPNIGREGETYLNHVLHRWDSLARQTIFLQAGIHNPREFYTHVRNYYSRQQTGFLNLGWSGNVCNCADCGDRLFWTDTTHVLPRLYAEMYNATPTACEDVLLSYKGQFIVSAARIRGISKDVYKTLWQAFIDENGWAHQQAYLQGRPDSMSTPDFGFTMERMWNLLFQCSNREVAWRCPSLVSGWRVGGEVADCQCFDE